MAPRLSIWNGVSINQKYQSVDDIASACFDLMPSGKWDVEWLVKAGEGPAYQSEFDNHVLAVSGPDKLASLLADGVSRDVPLWVTPYFVARGRPDWIVDEVSHIAECAAITGRCVINLEPGSAYWNGPTEAAWIEDNYLGPIWTQIEKLSSSVELEIATIPRQWVIDELGGIETMHAWRNAATSMSWECYGLTAADLSPDVALPRTDAWINRKRLRGFHVPIVQRDDRNNWSHHYRSPYGMQIWHLDGN